ncbi:DUF4124 domain-containing protein [Marinobacter sp. CHS3-4]|uniref:DUF4124 domain-containing protein n=1 Tax=Marinobacter sp. CHS3-4 TaxID=3045174 RepID=UPI0024B50B38|nr:DUF4124 domain-containing protein [Marinobacter sp. CHS3-4]MDI9246796.1 DUF4124 domain-containing protein [Marinobacter sp. CHS3-4]
MTKKILALAVFVLAMPILASAQSVYKWTDENGVTHFGDRKPTGKQSESVSVRTGKGSGSSSSSASPQQQVDQMEQEQAEVEQDEKVSAVQEARRKQRAANCDTAQTNLALIATGSRIKVQEDGEERYLSEEEIAQKREQFEKIAELNCGEEDASS